MTPKFIFIFFGMYIRKSEFYADIKSSEIIKKVIDQKLLPDSNGSLENPLFYISMVNNFSVSFFSRFFLKGF
jgi:hypothetical protein